MLATLPTDFTNLDQMVFSQSTIARLLMACALGGVVGLEREWRHKASGLRTNMLLCMGCSFFTVLSGVLAGPGITDKSRVASNIVQGVGFLGAGLILHERNRVVGLTSAATAFVVASIGMACGAGLYIEAALATVMVFASLKVIGYLESRSQWKYSTMFYEARGSDEGTMLARILDVLDGEGIRLNIVDSGKLGAVERVTFSVTTSNKRHKRLLAELAGGAVERVAVYSDDREE